MIQLEHPYIDEQGNQHAELEKHFSDEGKQIVQVETGTVYEDAAIDTHPSPFTYDEYQPPTEPTITLDENGNVVQIEGVPDGESPIV